MIITAGTILGSLVLGFAVWKASDWWLGRLTADELLLRLYKRIYRFGRWSLAKYNSGDTAFQFARAMTASMRQLGHESYWAVWFLEGEGMVREMTSIFVEHLFDPNHEPVASREIMQLYKQLRPRLWFFVLLSKAYPYRVLRPFLWENPPLLIPVSLEEFK